MKRTTDLYSRVSKCALAQHQQVDRGRRPALVGLLVAAEADQRERRRRSFEERFPAETPPLMYTSPGEDWRGNFG